MKENEISKVVFDCALKIHKALGPGLLESAYEKCLSYELTKSGLKVERQKRVPLIYKDVELEIGYKADLLIEDKVIIEIKATDALHPIHFSEVLTYIRLKECKLGMLINFNVVLIKDGIKRLVNNL